MRGHELARELRRKNGADRYPSVELGMIKLTEEVGELARAILRHDDAGIRKELGDLGLCAYMLSERLGVDLDDAMSRIVAADDRSFAPAAEA